MKLMHTFARFACVGALAMAMVSGAHASDRKTTNTLLGAGLGAAAGAVMSEGDPMLILGGAAAGGVLGNVLTVNSHSHSHGHKHYKNSRGHKHYKKHGWDHRGKNWNRGHYKKAKYSRNRHHGHRGHHHRR
ncbi:hypothetical protein [Pusillimonas sp. ANT_WB101]|uniref:hypothetical protein n=1 Tax=Pusillimonas sp. ANT_WB101 TaxID=2597356 RepID=UPI0011ED7603|nr:hypothetical protein [Pusillimonas sp. ANT_WB101]KAA0889450.1 hypothetical protein FQ179_20085 [Pusillimonas sp. ANT_WB101]